MIGWESLGDRPGLGLARGVGRVRSFGTPEKFDGEGRHTE